MLRGPSKKLCWHEMEVHLHLDGGYLAFLSSEQRRNTRDELSKTLQGSESSSCEHGARIDGADGHLKVRH